MTGRDYAPRAPRRRWNRVQWGHVLAACGSFSIALAAFFAAAWHALGQVAP